MRHAGGFRGASEGFGGFRRPWAGPGRPPVRWLVAQLTLRDRDAAVKPRMRTRRSFADPSLAATRKRWIVAAHERRPPSRSVLVVAAADLGQGPRREAAPDRRRHVPA